MESHETLLAKCQMAARRIAAGELDARTRIEYGNEEIGRLAAASEQVGEGNLDVQVPEPDTQMAQRAQILEVLDAQLHLSLAEGSGNTVIAAMIGPRYLKSTYAASEHPELNKRGARATGQTATVVEAFTGGRGKVRLGDTQWLARSADGSDLAAGARVEVVESRGTELVVKPA